MQRKRGTVDGIHVVVQLNAPTPRDILPVRPTLRAFRLLLI